MTSLPEAAGAVTAAPRKRRFPIQGTDLILLGLGVASTMALTITTGGNLLQPATTRAVLQFLAVPIVIGLSQMVVLAVGQMNLSVGVLTGLSAIISASLMVDGGVTPWLAVPAAVAVGIVAGLINGLLVVATRINGFIVTLATMTVIAGLRYGVNGTGTYQGYSDGLVDFGGSSVAGLPVVFIIAVLVGSTALLVTRPSSSSSPCWSLWPWPSTFGARSRADTCSPAVATRSQPGSPASPMTRALSWRTPCRVCWPELLAYWS